MEANATNKDRKLDAVSILEATTSQKDQSAIPLRLPIKNYEQQ
jgi:hypothetical protein